MAHQASQSVVTRFWRSLEPETSQSLSPAQREKITNALERVNPAGGNYSDVRFSIAGHFVVLLWGKERRSSERRDKEAYIHPILAAKNLPILAAIAGTIVSICYVLLHGSGRALISMMN